MISAAMAPGTQPAQVNNKTNNTEPHPLSITASGGKTTHNNTLPQPIL